MEQLETQYGDQRRNTIVETR